MNTLRPVDQQHRGTDKLRARTAVHASRKANGRGRSLPASSHPDPVQERDSSPGAKVRTGIVSVNGRDVEKLHCTGGHRSGR